MLLPLSSYKHNASFDSFVRLYKTAKSYFESMNFCACQRVIQRMNCNWRSNCIEYNLLLMRLYVYRGDVGDCRRFMQKWRCLEIPIREVWRAQEDGVMSLRRHAGRMYADFLYEKAQGLYLNERDADALTVYQECLDFVRKNHIPFPNRWDVAHKIAVLQYELSANGLKKTEALMLAGRVVNAWVHLRVSISKMGLNYLDHHVMTLAAVLNWLNSRYDQSRRFIDADMKNGGDKCVETLFVYAIIHLGNQSDRSMGILRRLSDLTFIGKCRIVVEKRKRIAEVALFILNLNMCRKVRSIAFVINGESSFVGLNTIQRLALKYVECHGDRKSKSTCFAEFLRLDDRIM